MSEHERSAGSDASGPVAKRNERSDDWSEPVDDLDEPRSPHAHPLEVISLTLGVVLLTMGLAFALFDIDVTEASLAWVGFGVLAATGLMLVAVGVKRHRASITPDRRSS